MGILDKNGQQLAVDGQAIVGNRNGAPLYNKQRAGRTENILNGGEDARSGKMSYERGNRLPFERRQLPKDFRANYERPLRDEVVNNLPGEKERGKSVVNT